MMKYKPVVMTSKQVLQHLFLLLYSVRLSLQRGYDVERHLKAFEQISSTPIPYIDCTTGVFTYAWNLYILSIYY